MADPLFTHVVGAVVNLFFTEVIDAAKSAYRYREKCRILLKSVNKLQPHIDGASQNSANWDDAQSNWLKEIKGLLDKGRRCATKGIDESKLEKQKRAITFWRWGKLPAELMDIVQRIEKAHQNVVFVAALETITYLSSLKSKKSLGFVPQQLPSDILGVEETFNRLKASILASYAKDKPSYLGLHGRGGAGKTLLAKMLHNDKDIIEKYGATSIQWITIGFDARVFDLYKTLGQFLKDGVFEKTYAHRSLKDQRSYLRNSIAQKKVLLILDDVWQENCEQNHDMMYWLNIATAPGSATLITTRSASVLSKVHAESEVVLTLSVEDSWKLFCFHAFNNGTPPSTISEELAKEVCKQCEGLPLALKVIGSAMVDKVNKEEWKSALHELKQSEPLLGSAEDDELFGRLRLSYDELKGDVLKTCFLYLAAFPEDYKIQTSTLFDIWIAEDLFASVDGKDAENKAWAHLESLAKRSLIYWDRVEDYVQMHDILRDLALYIIDKAKPDECAYECFFHSGKVIKSFPSGKPVQAIKRMSFMNCGISNWPQKFQVPNLQTCLLSKIVVPSNKLELKCFFSNMTSLKYLNLSKNQFNIEVNLSSFRGFNSLVRLDLSNCNFLEVLPQSIGELKCLTHLYLQGCESLKELPQSIGDLKCLTNLYLQGCKSLKELPQSIGKLTCLIHLNLTGCESLKEVPQSIGKLNCLTHLNLTRCESLKELPQSIGKLNCLTHLNLIGCESLKELPQSICELKCLTYLNLTRCKSLKELPESICELKYLTHFNLTGCEFLKELPESICKLKCLTDLNLTGCESLKELPQSICELKCLTHLNLTGCESLKELPQSICELKCLTHLNLTRCKSLKEVPQNICKLSSLTHLKLTRCESLKELPQSICELNCLTHLNLTGCESLKELPQSICELKCLTHLNLTRCKSLKELPQSICKLKCLTYLNLTGCESLKELPQSICELKCLTHLKLIRCKTLKELPQSIDELKCLTHFNLIGCKALKELPQSISELECLTHLNLAGCASLKELPQSIGDLKCLTNLYLQGCKSLKELPQSIGDLTCLTYLNLTGCESLKELLQSIGDLKCLTNLYLQGCKSLKELPQSIGDLKCLTNLYLQGCKSLKELSQSIGDLTCLTYLNLTGCESLKELLQSIGDLKCLTNLYLQGCKSLKELPQSIGKLKCLTHLNLTRCKSLMELPQSIGKLNCLTDFNLTGCESLKELPQSICELKCLTHLNLTRCKSLKELPQSICKLKCLTHLNLTGCKSLKELPQSICKLSSVTHLNLTGCESLKELPQSICELKCLTHLSLARCESLKELPQSIGNLKCVTNLYLQGCKSLKELPQSIGKLNCLTHLNLAGCKSLKELPQSSCELNCLTDLNLTGCEELKVFPLFMNLLVEKFQNRDRRLGWLNKWHELGATDNRIDVSTWEEALGVLGGINGIEYSDFRNKEEFIDSIGSAIFKLVPPDLKWEDTHVKGKLKLHQAIQRYLPKHLPEHDSGENVAKQMQQQQESESQPESSAQGASKASKKVKYCRNKFDLVDDGSKVQGSCLGIEGDQIEPALVAAESTIVDSKQQESIKKPSSSNQQEFLIEFESILGMYQENKNQSNEAMFTMDLLDRSIESGNNVNLLSKDSISQSLFQEDEPIIFCDYDEKVQVYVGYFNNYKDMACIVGVGFEYGKVIFEEGSQVQAMEISENDWESAWKNTSSQWTKLKVKFCQRDALSMKNTRDVLFLYDGGRPVLWDIAKYLASKRNTFTSILQDVVENGNTSNSSDSLPAASRSLVGNGNNSTVLRNGSIGGKEEGNGWHNGDERDAKKGKEPTNEFGDDPKDELNKKKKAVVHVDLLLSSGKFSLDTMELDDAVKKEHDLEDVVIKPTLDFEFSIDSHGTKNIQATIEGEFHLDVEVDISCANTYDFGWFHDQFLVSFGANCKHTKLLSSSKKLFDVTMREMQVKDQHTLVKQKGSEKEIRGGGSGGVHGILSLSGTLGEKSTKSSGETKLHEKNIIGNREVTKGGFTVDYAPKSRFPEKITYKYERPRNPKLNIKKLNDVDHREELKDSPMCKVQIVKFQATWEPRDIEEADNIIKSPTYVEYIFEALRDLRKIVHIGKKQKEENILSSGIRRLWIGSETSNFKEKFFEPKEIQAEQKYVKRLCLNHAMSHLNGGHFRFEEVSSESHKEVTHLMELIGNTLKPSRKGALVSFPSTNMSRHQHTPIQRECLVNAGFVSLEAGSVNAVRAALEPEGASFQHHQILPKECIGMALNGKDKILRVNVDGDTVEIVVQELIASDHNYKVKELMKSSGALCIGTYVDERFMKFLAKKVGCLDEFLCKESPSYKARLLKDWKEIKSSFGHEMMLDTIPMNINLHHKLAAKWEAYEVERGNSVDDSSVVELTEEDLKSIFDPVVDKILELIVPQLTRMPDVKVMFIVCGFIGLPYLMRRIQAHFSGEVIHNAISLALHPDAIVSCIAK